MKKIFKTIAIILITNVAISQNSEMIHQGMVIGSFEIGNKEVTTIYDENTGCVRKTSPHKKGLFVSEESVEIIIKENQGMVEVRKNLLIEQIFANLNCDESVGMNIVKYILDDFEPIPNNFDLEELKKNPDDLDEEKLNNQLHLIAEATKELIKDAGFNQIIIKLAQESGNQTAYLLDLECRGKQYYDAINTKLAISNTSLKAITEHMTHSPINPNPEFPETGLIEKYEPGIFIPNLNRVNKIKNPLISPNIEVNRVLNENSPLEDYIVTWFYDKSGSQHEILIGENVAIKITNPIFILDHASLKTKGKVNQLQNKSQASCSGNIRFDSKEIRINSGYRHETGLWNKSEYSIVGYLMKSDGTNPEWVYDPSGWKKIGKIKPSQIGTDRTFETLHACNWEPYSQNKFYWNTFERDWNRSQKDLGSASYGGKTIYLSGNMRYDNDWYAWIPNTLNLHNTPFEWFGWEVKVNFYSWKADYWVYDVPN